MRVCATYNDELKRLAVYGSLQPGGPNHYILENIPGIWSSGIVRGYLEESGWGAKIGFPGLHLSEQGDEIEVKLFEYQNLSDLLKQLDDFEGDEYTRQVCSVVTPNGPVFAYIYALSQRQN